jgi:hypothetical protein
MAAAESKQANILLGEGEAARKRLVMQADGALAQKLEAYVAVQTRFAEAFENRKVPQTVFGAANGSTDSDVSAFMQLMTVKAAQDLGLNPNPTK